MAEKDLANMPLEELKAYCDELAMKLDEAQWFLRNRLMCYARGKYKEEKP